MSQSTKTPYQPPQVDGATWRDGELPAYHGQDWHIREDIYPGRRVLEGAWPAARPEECRDFTGRGVWMFDGQLLICPGCGLDCT